MVRMTYEERRAFHDKLLQLVRYQRIMGISPQCEDDYSERLFAGIRNETAVVLLLLKQSGLLPEHMRNIQLPNYDALLSICSEYREDEENEEETGEENLLEEWMFLSDLTETLINELFKNSSYIIKWNYELFDDFTIEELRLIPTVVETTLNEAFHEEAYEINMPPLLEKMSIELGMEEFEKIEGMVLMGSLLVYSPLLQKVFRKLPDKYREDELYSEINNYTVDALFYRYFPGFGDNKTFAENGFSGGYCFCDFYIDHRETSLPWLADMAAWSNLLLAEMAAMDLAEKAGLEVSQWKE